MDQRTNLQTNNRQEPLARKNAGKDSPPMNPKKNFSQAHYQPPAHVVGGLSFANVCGTWKDPVILYGYQPFVAPIADSS